MPPWVGSKPAPKTAEPANDAARPRPDPRYGYVAPQMLRGMLDVVENSAKSARDCLLSAANGVASSDACAEVLCALGELHKVIETVDNTRKSFDAREEVTP